MKKLLTTLAAIMTAVSGVSCSRDQSLEKDALGATIVLSAPKHYTAICEENARLRQYFNAFSDSHHLLTCFIADEALRKIETGEAADVYPDLQVYVAGIRGDVSLEEFNAIIQDFSSMKNTKEIETEANRLMDESGRAVSQVTGQKTEINLDVEKFIQSAQRPYFKLKKASCFTFEAVGGEVVDGKPARSKDVTALCMALIKKRSLTFKSTMVRDDEQSVERVKALALDSMQTHFSINGEAFE